MLLLITEAVNVLHRPAARVLPVKGALDLEATLFSGQAFRWERRGSNRYRGFIDNRPAEVWKTHEGDLAWASHEPLAPERIAAYFRLDRTHDEFLQTAGADPFLQTALRAFPGLRLLRQNPWEALIGFVLSQNSNEAKIRRTIHRLAELSGEPVQFQGDTLYRFPTPLRLAALKERALRATGMGYRARYVQAAASRVASGLLVPEQLAALPYEVAFSRLLDVPGIGAKVADCVLLYGCDHRNAFPSDVWVRRFIRETYLRRRRPSHDRLRALARERFGANAGYAQHYLFHYRRMVGKLEASAA